MDIKEISDKLEINEVLIAYANAIDSKEYQQLDSVFSEDAVIDFTEVGGPHGNRETILAYLQQALAPFPKTQHMLGNITIEINGDEATSKTMCHNPMVLKNNEGKEETFFIGLWYLDNLRRTDNGWRIQKRKLELCYVYDEPDQLNIANK